MTVHNEGERAVRVIVAHDAISGRQIETEPTVEVDAPGGII